MGGLAGRENGGWAGHPQKLVPMLSPVKVSSGY